MITIRNLISRNREAVRTGNIQAIRAPMETSYEDEDGCRCAIGLVLSDADLKLVRHTGSEDLIVQDIVRMGIVQVENLAVFRATQILHDAWSQSIPPSFIADQDVPVLQELPDHLYNWLSKIVFVDGHVFLCWLDQVEAEFCPQPQRVFP